MGRRTISLVLLFILSGVLLAGPALAKCCPLDHIVVSGVGAEEIVTAAELEDQLHPAQLMDLYWPVLQGPFKGDDRPRGDLGPAYELTYVLKDADRIIELRETAYLEAQPPVGFTPQGQTHELFPGDVRAVEPGWRPFPERASNALLFLLDQPAASLEADVAGYTRSWWARWDSVAGLLLVLCFGAWMVLRRRRHVAARPR